MHTVIVVAIGLGLLGLSAVVGSALGSAPGIAAAAMIFLPLWFIGAGLNLYLGVTKAGYSVADETPIFLAVFAIPAVAALLVWWRFH
jgi:hypothetical protein